ncbi:MAG: WD40 repeat domain-containing protein [Chloroflexi bacterium]|nr:WD40 repeat domain-containing protein [Chloroflexota bacterium]MBU1747832.1 WD40 repeat domain-containing protein [Chloroflexota bacterium]
MTNQNDQVMVGDHRTILKSFSRALAREAHVLTRQPDLLWQQLYNRLQWEGEEVEARLAPERERRTAPWLRLRLAPRESSALLRTLAGHTGSITACAVSPDGAIIVSASRDGTLKIWDAQAGRGRFTLAGHAGSIRGLAVSPGGSFIVSAGGDGLLKVWDARTGTARLTLAGHTGAVDAVVISPDGAFIASSSADKTVWLWDVHTGAERASLPLSGGRTCLA